MKRLLASVFLAVHFIFSPATVKAEPETSQAVADRYEQVLERSPQAGPAFDRIFEWYQGGGGGLEVLQQRWKERANGEQRRSYLILLGLLAERQRETEKARTLYKEALALEGEKALAAKPLAVLETTEGNFPAAAAAYDTALASPSLTPADRLELMRALALLYQRAFDTDKALGIWRKAVEDFSGDQFVLEEAGEAFLTAAAYEDARKSFTRLRELTAGNPFQQIAASLRLARTAELAGKSDEAMEIYARALDETSSGSWINREVRAQIEALYRRKDDLPGLLGFYERRVKAAPQDYLTLVAQASVLEDLGKAAEAVETARTAAKLAPENLDLRVALVRRLQSQGRTDEAIAEASTLGQAEAPPPRVLALLGDLHWAQYEQTKDDKARSRAMAAWNRIAPGEIKDTSRIAQLADILTTRGLVDDAMAQWQRIAALAPDLPEPRRRLAEIYLKRQDKKAAAEILAPLVEGPNAQAANFVSLARIQERLEMEELSRETARNGLELFPTNFDLLALALRQAMDAKDAEAAAKLYPVLWVNAPGDFLSADVEKRYAVFLESAGTAKETQEKLTERLTQNTLEPADAALLFRLALSRHDEETAKKALDATKAGPHAVRAARAAFDFAQVFGSADDQVAALQALASTDTRLAGESLRLAARIQADSGQLELAIQTIASLIDRTPNDVSLYSAYADFASRAGRTTEAADRLRKAIGIVDDATTLRLQLASLLDTQGKGAEAMKTLQDAFESEPADGRRMEIFRRQIEQAARNGTIEELITGLREKQAREQGGAHYGAYLAEIYIAQNDFLAAREELTRSLGRTPDNPGALSRLLDLADRGGDRDEGIRLARKLAEMAPSAANRAAYLSRLFESGDLEKARSELEGVRAEIPKDPAAWNTLLITIRKAGLENEANVLAEEIAAAAEKGILQDGQIARLRLMQRDYEAAETALWQVLEAGDLAAALAAVEEDVPPGQAKTRGPEHYVRMLPFQTLAAEAIATVQQILLPYRGYYSPRSSAAPGQHKATAEQREQVRALFLLSRLANARRQDEAFRSRLGQVLADRRASRRLRFIAQHIVNNFEGLNALIEEQAADPKADPETDRFMLAMLASSPSLMVEKSGPIRERLRKSDPKIDFESLVEKTRADWVQLQLNTSPTAADRDALRKAIDTLRKHPGNDKSALSTARLASLAALADEDALALELCAEAEDALAQGAPPQVTAATNILRTVRLGAIGNAIQRNSPSAPAELEKFLQTASAPARSTAFHQSPSGIVLSRNSNPLAQATPDLVAGDSMFPLAAFRRLCPYPAGSPQAEKARKWFDTRASTELTVFTLGAFYADWQAGKRESAIKRLEKVRDKNPGPRVAALLLEACERDNQPAKALAVASDATLQVGETADLRALRTIRLQRSAGHLEEARASAERLARGRVSYVLRTQLANELMVLGVPPSKYPHLSSTSINRPASSRDRSEQTRRQIEKLVNEKKTAEAERLVLQTLARPLPSPQDYRESNARGAMLDTLRNMQRLETLRATLRDKLDENPGDFDTAIRLSETEIYGSDKNSGNLTLVDFLEKNPVTSPSLGYALQLLRNRAQASLPRVIIALLKTNPAALANSGMQLIELLNSDPDPMPRASIAEAVASMSDVDYNALFLPSRIGRDQTEIIFITQLAESAASANHLPLAIALLARARAAALADLNSGLPALLRLAELQNQIGDREGAMRTMKNLIENRGRRSGGFFSDEQELVLVLVNQIHNHQGRSRGGDLIQRVGRIAELTGTLDGLLASLDNSPPTSLQVSPALIVRTALKTPDAVKRWRSIILSETSSPSSIEPQILPSVVELIAGETDAKKLIPALLRKATMNNATYAEGALASLAGTLPLLGNYREDPAVQRFVTQLSSQVFADPNGPRYFLFSPSYSAALNALIDANFIDDARRLFEASIAERNSRNLGYGNVFSAIEKRLAAIDTAVANVDILCLALPDRPVVRWKAFPALNDGEIGDGQQSSTISWDTGKTEIPKSIRPVELEIFAGPNPASLEPVARVANPQGAEGDIQASIPAGAGLLQARWKLADGSRRSGSLTSYIRGENLISNNGVPKAGDRIEAFRTSQPGPLGDKSAVAYEALSPTHQTNIEIAKIDVNGEPALFAFTGWIRSNSRGAAPYVSVKLVRDTGKTDSAGTYHRTATPGQWGQNFQLWSVGEFTSGAFVIDKTVRQILVSLSLNASGGYNSQYVVEGSWDGLQFVRLPVPANNTEAGKARDAFRAGLKNKDYPAAAAAFLISLKLEPTSILEQPAQQIIEVFKKTNRTGELFTKVVAPSLLLPNPMTQQQPTLRNTALVDALIREAAEPDAPPEAKTWLAQIRNLPLPENIRFTMDTAAFRQAAAADPTKANVPEILATLGLRDKAVKTGRLRMLWNFTDAGKSTAAVLEMLDDEKKASEAISLARAIDVPPNLLSSRLMLEAWLLAPSDPETALKVWTEALNLRYGGSNSVNVDIHSDRTLLLRIIHRHPKPSDLVAAANNWLTKMVSHEAYTRRILVELLYDAAKSDSPQRDEYALLWADAEMAALKTPGYDASRDRLRELTTRLMAAGDWTRLEGVLDLAKGNQRLANDPIQREFEQLRDLAAFGRGNLDAAWPVVWYQPAEDGLTVINWQWNTKDIVPDKGDFDTALSIAEKPLIPEIKGQQAVEVHFGEMPSELKTLAQEEGSSAQGSLKTKLPAPNGFLRAVAIVDGRRIPGPMIPVISGQPVYPSPGASLKDLLTTGSKPLAPELLSDAGMAPDGSPAVRIGNPNERRRLAYEGPDFPVTPGKFYVLRAWLRRAGSGSASMSSEFKPVKTSTKGPLNMLLSDQQETTGQWVYYTRAVPALDQHTFWIPADEVETMTPKFWDLDPGTEIAGWDLVEVENWKYAAWLTDLATVRRQAGRSPDAVTLDRALTLASVEPLTSLDYHGDWLGQIGPKAGKEDRIFSLYRAALAAEPNPLFSRPKLWRLFSNLGSVLNRGDGSPGFRWQMAQLALANAPRMNSTQRLAFQAHALTLAPSTETKAELAKAIRGELTKRLQDEQKGAAFLKEAVGAHGSRDGRPSSELINLLLALDDDETTSLILMEVRGQPGDSLELSDKIFVTMALEACLAKSGNHWPDEVKRAYRATEESDSPDAFMRWSYALADLLTAKKIAPETVLALRQQGLERVLQSKPRQKGQILESIRAAAFLIETSLAQSNSGAAAAAVAAILPELKENSGKLSEDSLRILLNAVNLLAEAGDTQQVAALVTTAEPDIRRHPETTEAWAAYLKPGA